MPNYPSAVDDASTLYSPVNAFSTKTLETTATGAIGAGDSSISVSSTAGGFAAAYGILSIDDELVIYTATTGSQFTGCQRGAFGTTAAIHANGVTVKANMVAGFITALQSAVLAIENELGTAAARNYVQKNGAVTVTGLKTFQDGAEFGSGSKAATGLVRLPNTGAVKWRKADNSGDLGMALNGSNHIAMDAVIDFATGQTFGAFSYPDATTTSKGILQVDPTGGLTVAAGVASLAATGVVAGTYPKVTVDAKGRVTGATTLVSGDIPAHTHVATDIVSGSLPFTIQKAGTAVGTRRALNLIEGSNVTLTVADDAGNDRVNVTVAAAGGTTTHNLLSATHPDTAADSPVLGDLVAANSTPAWTRLAGQTTTTRKFLRQAGTGSASALPAWDTLVSGDLPAHNHAAGDINSGALALARGGAAADLSATGPGFLKQAAMGAAVTVAAIQAGDLAAHTHAESDITGLVTDLANRPVKGAGWAVSKAAVINSSGQLDGAAGTATDCMLVDGSSAAKANASHTHAESDVTGLVTDLAGKAAASHTHAESDVTSLVTDLAGKAAVSHNHSESDVTNLVTDLAGKAAASHPHAESDVTGLVTDLAGKAAVSHTHAESDVTGLVTDLAGKAAKAGDTFTGTLRIGGDQGYLECGPYQTVGGAFENMAKYSEDFTVATWDKNGGSCSATGNSATAPDGNATADTITAVTATPIIQQQIAGLVSGGQYTFYVWAKVASGTKQVSIAIVDNAYAGYLAGPTNITLTAVWQRFKITGTLAGGQTGLWIVVRQFAGNGDNWTSGSIYLWGACLQQGNDPKNGYARTWAFQTANIAAGIACGAVVISAKDNAESPLRVYGPGSNLADHLAFAVNSAGEVTIAGGAGNGYMLSQLQAAVNPSGWSGVIQVKNPAGVTAGYIILYTNP